MNQDYVDTVRLLLAIAPLVFKPSHFALKGGTAQRKSSSQATSFCRFSTLRNSTEANSSRPWIGSIPAISSM